MLESGSAIETRQRIIKGVKICEELAFEFFCGDQDVLFARETRNAAHALSPRATHDDFVAF